MVDRQEENNDRNDLVLVLGMHRSGTSALTKGLEVLGVSLGSTLNPPNPNVNAKGFWEDTDVNSLNIELLDALGLDWHALKDAPKSTLEAMQESHFFGSAVSLVNNRTANTERFGLKDPRISRLLPFWMRVIEEADVRVRVLLALRNPLSVAKSLATRDHFAPEKSHFLWLMHVLPSLRWVLDHRGVIIDFDCLIKDPEAQLQRVAACFGYSLGEKALADYADNFLENDLRHGSFTVSDLKHDTRCPDLVAKIYTRLLEFSALPHAEFLEALKGEIDSWEHEAKGLYQCFGFVEDLISNGQTLEKRLEIALEEGADRDIVKQLLRDSAETSAAALDSLHRQVEQAVGELVSSKHELGINLSAKDAEIQTLRVRAERSESLL